VRDILGVMERGRTRTGSVPVGPIVAAYARLFSGDFDGALGLLGAVPRTPYGAAVAAQIEALCTASTCLPEFAVPPRPLDAVEAMTVFHLSEAAHVVGRIDDCVALLQSALAAGVESRRVRAWLRLGLVRGLLFQGRVADAGAALEPAELDVTSPFARESARCLRAMVAGLSGDPGATVAAAERIRLLVAIPDCYAHSGIALLAAYGLASSGMPRAAADLLRHGSGGPRLTLLPPALRAYGYDMLVEAAIAARQLDLAERTLRDFDALDLAGNRQLEAARETSRGRVLVAFGDFVAGTGRARDASRQAHDAGSALVGVRASLAALPAVVRERRVGDEEVVPDDLRLWLERALKESGRAGLARPDWRRLTQAQLAVARLAARGSRNQEIADALVVSLRTVEGHIASILDVLGVESRVGIVAGVPLPRELDAAALGMMTRRQREVALLLVDGRSNDQIAERLGVGRKAVEAHVSALLRAFGLPSRSALVARLLTPHDRLAAPTR